MGKVLIAGESWTKQTTHIKGFDIFNSSVYETGVEFLQKALEAGGWDVTFLPNHLCMEEFPWSVEELKQYDVVMLSDIGACTLLLPPAVFDRSEKRPNRCKVLRDYVLDGGGLVMIGGYMTFAGIDGRGKWHDTATQEVVPVTIMNYDDRMEHCEGVKPVTIAEHPILKGISGEWPDVLGYKKTEERPGGKIIATVEGDPFLAVGEYGKGRGVAFTTDCAPHWAPPEFIEWKYYNQLWQNIAAWAAGEI